MSVNINTITIDAPITIGITGPPGPGVATGGTTGQSLIKLSNDDFDTAWQTPAGGGDMTALVYDPNTVAGDAFDMDNMVEGTALILTGAERTAISNNTAKATNVSTTFGAFTPTSTSITVTSDGNSFTLNTAGGISAGLMSAANSGKLAFIEDNATADQTGAEIKTAYEAEANAYTDTKDTKLGTIETGADVTDEANVVSSLDGATLTDIGTPAATDKVLIQDADDSDNLKSVAFSEFGGGNPFDQDLNTTDAPQFIDLALNNGLTSSELTISNTDDGAGNSETFFARWNSDTLEIGCEAAGTGVVRDVNFTGNVGFGTSAPTKKVEVYDAADETLLVLRNDGSGLTGLGFRRSSGAGGNMGFIGIKRTFSPDLSSSELHLKNATSSSTAVTNLLIDTAGNTNVNGLNATGTVQSGTFTVATLPTASAGMTCFVSDGSVVHASNSGSIVAGAGSNFVPVYYDGTNWRIT